MDIREEIQKVLLTLAFAQKPYSKVAFSELVRKTIRPKESYYDVFEAQNNYNREVFTYKVQPRQYGHMCYTMHEDLKVPQKLHVDVSEETLRKAFHSGNTFCNYVNELCEKIYNESNKEEWKRKMLV